MKRYTPDELKQLNADIDTAMFQCVEDFAAKHKPMQSLFHLGEFTDKQKLDIAMTFAAMLNDGHYPKH